MFLKLLGEKIMKEPQAQRWKIDWSELSLELLAKIAELIESPADKFRFQLVCKKWNSSVPSSLSLLYYDMPYQLPTHPTVFKQPGEPKFLVGTDVYLLQPLKPQSTSSKPWLISVVELNPGKLRLYLPLTSKPIEKLPSNFPTVLDLSDFQASLIGDGCKLCYRNGVEDVFHEDLQSSWGEYPSKCKLELISYPENTSNHCKGYILLLFKGGILASVSLSVGKWRIIEYDEFNLFDDILGYMGCIYVIDRQGRAQLIYDSNKVISEPMCAGAPADRRKRLAVSDSELYLIERLRYTFRVYKLNGWQLDGPPRKWVEVDSLGDRILFVTYDNCFFVGADKIPGCRGNCILFPKNCFPSYSGQSDWDDELFKGANKYNEIGVFFLGEDRCQLISSIPGLSNLFWPPPSWISTHSSITGSVSDETEEPRINPPKSIASEESSSPKPASVKMVGNVHVVEDEVQDMEIKDDVPCQNIKHSTPARNLLPQFSADDVMLVKFEGVELSSDLVTILHKLWDKHGNIIQEHKVRSKALLTWALESLAKMVLFIQNNLGRSLIDSKAEYLETTLIDLQSLHFRLDWLVPFVKAFRKNTELNRVKMELENKRCKLLAELHEVEVALVEQNKLVAESLSAFPQIEALL